MKKKNRLKFIVSTLEIKLTKSNCACITIYGMCGFQLSYENRTFPFVKGKQ